MADWIACPTRNLGHTVRAVAVGMGEAEPPKTMAEVLDEKSLFEFFVDAQPRPPAR